MAAAQPQPLTAEERRRLRSINTPTPHPTSDRCPACGTAQNPYTGECAGCSD